MNSEQERVLIEALSRIGAAASCNSTPLGVFVLATANKAISYFDALATVVAPECSGKLADDFDAWWAREINNGKANIARHWALKGWNAAHAAHTAPEADSSSADMTEAEARAALAASRQTEDGASPYLWFHEKSRTIHQTEQPHDFLSKCIPLYLRPVARQTKDGGLSAAIPSWKDRARYDKVEVVDAATASKYMSAEITDLRNRLASTFAPKKPAAQGGVPEVVREAVEAAFEGREGWMRKIAAAVRALAAPTGDHP